MWQPIESAPKDGSRILTETNETNPEPTKNSHDLRREDFRRDQDQLGRDRIFLAIMCGPVLMLALMIGAAWR